MLCRLLGQEIFGGNNASIVYGRQREKVMQNGREEVREKEIEREKHIKREGDRERGGAAQSVGGHTTECASSLSAILVRSNFKSTQKKKSNENR